MRSSKLENRTQIKSKALWRRSNRWHRQAKLFLRLRQGILRLTKSRSNLLERQLPRLQNLLRLLPLLYRRPLQIRRRPVPRLLRRSNLRTHIVAKPTRLPNQITRFSPSLLGIRSMKVVAASTNRQDSIHNLRVILNPAIQQWLRLPNRTEPKLPSNGRSNQVPQHRIGREWVGRCRNRFRSRFLICQC